MGMRDQPPPKAPPEAPESSRQLADGLQTRLEVTHGMLDVISEAIYILDAEGRFLDVNEGAVRMYGHPRSFFIGQTPAVLSAPGRNDMEALGRAIAKALQGEPQEFEYWGLRQDGSVFPKEVHLYPGTHQGQKVLIAIAQDISERTRAGLIQEATYRIAEAALDSRNSQELFPRIHAIVRGLMPAENLYFALWDRASDTVSFPYWIDEVDPAPEPRHLRRGLTEFVLRRGQALLVDEAALLALEQSGEVEPLGTLSLDWLGVPLRGETGVFGALVIQSYEGGHRYAEVERDLLVYVSAQVAMAIERIRAQSEQRILTAAMDCAIDPVFGISQSGRLVFANRAACTSLGYSREDLLQRSVWDVDPLVTAEQWPARWERVKVRGANREETRHRRKDGFIYSVEISSSFLDHDGQEMIFTHARDISSRKAAETALRSSEDKFSKTFLASPDAININRLDGTYVDINPAFTRMSGWSREETIGRSTVDLGLWVNLEDRARMQRQLQAGGHFVDLEALFRMKDGAIRTGLVSGTLIQVDGETCLLTITRDITERKAAEAAIRYNEDKFSRAFHGSPDAININRLDDSTYLDVSEGFEKLTGWTRAESIGRTALDMNIWVDLEDRRKVVELIKEHGEYTGQEIRFRRKDGSILTGLMSGKLMEVDGVPCLLSVTRDITDRRLAEDALRQSQKLESLGLLAGGIAHDFNNLLTVVLGNLNLAQMNLPDDARAQPYLANMEATVLRATELTKQMLAYSGRGHFLVKPQDLNEVVREVTHLLEVSISKKIHLKFELEPGLPAIQADAAQVQQVVMNLVTNASDAIGDREGIIHLSTARCVFGERELHTTFRGESLEPGPYVLLEVSDTGGGMSQEVMTRIFDPFFTTKATGRGLGLSAMLGILRGHGAGLNITSEVAQGSTFRICFPASEEGLVPAVPIREVASAPRLRGRVLLVDDEDLILQTIGSALKALGLEVFTARDGVEALERFRESPRPDLVLMDLTMPRMDGREAFQVMHSLDPSVPVVLSSGFTEQDSIQTLSGHNPAAFIQKPYQIKVLRQLLRRVLSN